MPDGTVTIAGEPVGTWERAVGGVNEEYVRISRVQAATLDEWALATTARATPIAALASRIAVLFYNDSETASVFLRFDGTNPTTTSYSMVIRPRTLVSLAGDWAALNIRMIADAANGTLHTTLGDAP